MQLTGKGTNPKTTLYVGGLEVRMARSCWRGTTALSPCHHHCRLACHLMQPPLVPLGAQENVNEAGLHAAFLPFGDIKDVTIPLDHATGKLHGRTCGACLVCLGAGLADSWKEPGMRNAGASVMGGSR